MRESARPNILWLAILGALTAIVAPPFAGRPMLTAFAPIGDKWTLFSA